MQVFYNKKYISFYSWGVDFSGKNYIICSVNITMKFINLRNYTENTFQTGVPTPTEYVKKAVEMWLPMVAITDKNRTHGVIEFYRSAKSKKISPIIGANAYYERNEYKREVVHTGGKDRVKINGVEQIIQHNLLLFPLNDSAYESFLRVISFINVEDEDIFNASPELFKDIIVVVDKHTVKNKGIEFLEEFFSEGVLLYEVQNQYTNDYVKPLIERVGIEKIVFTNPTYFLDKEDASLKVKIKAIKDKTDIEEVETHNDFSQNYFKSTEDFLKTKKFTISDEDFNLVLENTHKLLSQISINLTFDVVLIPKYELNPEDEEFYLKHKDKSKYPMGDEEWWLRYSCYRNLEERFRNPQAPDFDFSLSEEEVIEMVWRENEPVLEWKLADMEIDSVKENAWSTFSEKKNNIIGRLSKKMRDIIYRLEYELYVIHHCGYDGYSLIVADYVNYAKNNGYAVWPGRGSAAGSLASYLCKITDVDPIKYDLMFERYLNFSRVSAPDIDVDFSSVWRQMVYDYCVKRYGADKVTPVSTFGTTAAKSSIKDMGRIMGVSPSETNRITMAMSNRPWTSLKTNMEEVGTFSAIINKNETYQELYKNACLIEGKKRQQGVHACAIIISPEDILKFSALQYQPNKLKELTLKKARVEKQEAQKSPIKENEDESIEEEVNTSAIVDSSWETYAGVKAVEADIMTQLEAHDLEALGLLKMDFLVIKNLTILERTLELIKQRHWKTINISTLDYNDPFVYATVFKPGKTTSIFQLESRGMRNNLKALKPEKLEHIIAMNALYRPGPMAFIPSYIKRRLWEEEVKHLNPVLKDVTDDTYGIVVYQEQLMKMTEVYAGYSMKMADELRKWVGKKKKDIIDKHKDLFINGAVANGHKAKEAEEIYMDVIVPAGSYSFNKSHAACYAVVAFQWAYMKAYYPLEYMFSCMVEAVLDSKQSDLAVLVEEFTNMWGTVLPVSINKSTSLWSIEGDMTIRLWFASLSRISETTGDGIVNIRWDKPFSSYEDFVTRYKEELSKTTIEGLARSGAFDELWIDANLILNEDNLKNITRVKNLKSKASKVKKAFTVDFSNLGNMISQEKEEIPFYLATNEYTPITHYEKARNQYKINGFFLNINPLSWLSKYIHKFERKNRERLFVDKSNSTDDKEDKKVALFCYLSEIKEYKDAANRLTLKGKVIGIDYKLNIILNTEAAERYGYELSNNIWNFIMIEWDLSISEYGKNVYVQSIKAVKNSIDFSNGIKEEWIYDKHITDMRKAFSYDAKEIDPNKNIFLVFSNGIEKNDLIAGLQQLRKFLEKQDSGNYNVVLKDAQGREKELGFKIKTYYQLHKYLKQNYQQTGEQWCRLFVDDKEFLIG